MEAKYEVIQTIDLYIPRLINGITAMMEEFKGNNIDVGKKLLLPVIDGIGWILEAIELCKDILREDLKISELVIVCGEILGGMENEDYILTIDLFEYEVIPKLEEWSDIVRRSRLPIM